MHLYLVPRGILNQVELWKAALQSQYFQFKRINLDTGKEEVIGVQGALRPSILGTYEYVFPKEALPEVIAMLNHETHDHIKTKLLRTIMGIKAIPKKVFKQAEKIPSQIIFKESKRILNNCKIPGVAVHLIGYKDDKTQDFDFGKEGRFFQEGL